MCRKQRNSRDHGARDGLDVARFLLAGASAVEVGTVVFHDPSAPARVARELQSALAARGFDRFADAVGFAHRGPEPNAIDVEAEPETAGAEG